MRSAIGWLIPGAIGLSAVTAAVALIAAPATATTIRYEVTDLADVVQGEDLRRYTYIVQDFDFDTDYGFTIFFDVATVGSLDSPPPAVSADWDPIAVQPDGQLPADGFYDALALADDASLTDPFVVDFVWLGPGEPGAQGFVVYQPGFQTIESGITVPVPEPATAALLTLGMAAAAATHRRRPRTPVGR